MNRKLEAPEVKNNRHLEKVEQWYRHFSSEILVVSSDEFQSIFLVKTVEEGIELARAFSIGDSVEISIDYSGANNIEDIRQLILNYNRVAN